MSRAHLPPAGPIWRAPIVLGGLTAIGLLSGLLGDGAWDAVAWLGLGIPTAACCWYGLKR